MKKLENALIIKSGTRIVEKISFISSDGRYCKPQQKEYMPEFVSNPIYAGMKIETTYNKAKKTIKNFMLRGKSMSVAEVLNSSFISEKNKLLVKQLVLENEENIDTLYFIYNPVSKKLYYQPDDFIAINF